MNDQIELQHKNDRELLVMAVMQGNEAVRHLVKINSTILEHERRITKLEMNSAAQNAWGITVPTGLTKGKAVGISSGLIAIGGFIGALLYAFGSGIGWW